MNDFIRGMKQVTPLGKLDDIEYCKKLIGYGHDEDSIRRSLLSIFSDDSAYEVLTS